MSHGIAASLPQLASSAGFHDHGARFSTHAHGGFGFYRPYEKSGGKARDETVPREEGGVEQETSLFRPDDKMVWERNF